MRSYKKILFLVIILFCISILKCISSTKNDSEKRKEVKYLLAFANDPNGIAIYKNPKDLTSKIGLIPYKEKFEISSKHNNELSDSEVDEPQIPFLGNNNSNIFISNAVSFKDLKGFIINGDSINFNLEKNNYDFGVVETENEFIYESPFDDAKQIGYLNQFEIIKNLRFSNSRDNWKQIQFSGKTGYTRANIFEYKTKKEAENASILNIVHLHAYFKVNNKNPNIFNVSNLQKISNNITEILSSRLEFYRVIYYFKKQETVYYGIATQDDSFPNEDKKENLLYETVLVTEKSGLFIPKEKFTEYTLENTRYKGDKSFFDLLKKENEPGRFDNNFMDLEKKFLVSKGGAEYYLLTFQDGIQKKQFKSEHRNTLAFLKKEKAKYTLASETLSYLNTRLINGKNNSTFEIHVYSSSRGGTVSEYGFKDGQFQLLRSALY